MQLTLKAARGKRKLSLSKLAAKSGVTKSTINRIERGVVTPLNTTVVALEHAMELEPGTLKFSKAS